jgi:hypothetical protein
LVMSAFDADHGNAPCVSPRRIKRYAIFLPRKHFRLRTAMKWSAHQLRGTGRAAPRSHARDSERTIRERRSGAGTGIQCTYIKIAYRMRGRCGPMARDRLIFVTYQYNTSVRIRRQTTEQHARSRSIAVTLMAVLPILWR